MIVIDIYFDTCCYNRPFDDLSQEIIYNEYDAIKNILKLIKNEKVCIYKSDAIIYELKRIKENKKRWRVFLFYRLLRGNEIQYNESIRRRAIELTDYNFKFMDALHIAMAESANIDYFITTDKILINASKRLKLKVKVLNPIDFMEVFEDE